MCDNGENYNADEDMIPKCPPCLEAVQKHGDNNLSHLIMSTPKIFTLLQFSDFVQQLLAFCQMACPSVCRFADSRIQILLHKTFYPAEHYSIVLPDFQGCVAWFQFYK